MNYCSNCGAKVELKIPDDDNRERYVCPDCHTVHYDNPNTVVGAIPLYEGGDEPKILLCKRGIEPRLGFWTLPAGFLENDETVQDGAARETYEESCATIIDLDLYRVMNVVRSRQIHMFFRANLPEPKFTTTPESTEVALFGFDEIPWSQLAFPTVYRALKDFVADYRAGAGFTNLLLDTQKSDWAELDETPNS